MITKGKITLEKSNSVFFYSMEHYKNKSKYGINGGRISKLMLKKDGDVVYRYDRGIDLEPIDQDTKIAFRFLLQQYN